MNLPNFHSIVRGGGEIPINLIALPFMPVMDLDNCKVEEIWPEYTDGSYYKSDGTTSIYVATPPSSHATYAIMAMKAGKPVYVEKPLASNYEDCARVNRISEQTGIPCFVAYYRRYLPYFQKVKDIVKSGQIGKILNVQIRYTEPLRAADYEAIKNGDSLPWRLQPDIAGGGYFYDMAPHQLDLLQDMFGV